MSRVDVRLTKERADRGRAAYMRNISAKSARTLPCSTPGCPGKISQLSKSGKCGPCNRRTQKVLGIKVEIQDSISNGWEGAGRCLGGPVDSAHECDLVWGDLNHRHCPGLSADEPCGEPVAGYWEGLCGYCTWRGLPHSQVGELHTDRPEVETIEHHPHRLLRPIKAAKPSEMLTSDSRRGHWPSTAA